MFRLCGLQLGPNIGVRPVADKKKLFGVNGGQNARVCGFYQEIFTVIRLQCAVTPDSRGCSQ